MATSSATYLTDRKGRKKAIVIDIREYRRLLERLEELEDALDLDKAVRSAKSFKDYREVFKELRGEGRL
jgi:hypothetical protein